MKIIFPFTVREAEEGKGQKKKRGKEVEGERKPLA